MKEYAYIHEDGTLPTELKTVPFLNSFNDEQLDEVLTSSNIIQAEPGDVIIQEGSIDTRIYILLSGELEVRVGGKRVAAITRAGEVFGELALVNQDKRVASVVAAQSSFCLAVDQKFLQDIHPREEDPAFHAALFEFVARLIAKKLDATSRRLAEVEKELRALREASASQPVKVVRKTVKVVRKQIKVVKTVSRAPAKKAVKTVAKAPARQAAKPSAQRTRKPARKKPAKRVLAKRGR
jgi:CRP-like cAMP-binding protein